MAYIVFPNHISFSIPNDREKPQAGTKMTECQNQASAEHDSQDRLLRLLLSGQMCTDEKKGWNKALLREKGGVFVKKEVC